jgi:peptide/nickel transport system substrate-binding protein
LFWPCQHFITKGGKRRAKLGRRKGYRPSEKHAENVLANIVGCRDESRRGGLFIFGSYCNPKVDALAKEILVATDTNKRDDMIAEAFHILHQDVSHIPLHQQALAWGVAKGTTSQQTRGNLE